jgi:hypothetical protein
VTRDVIAVKYHLRAFLSQLYTLPNMSERGM